MIHPRPYSRGFLFTETKAIELFRGQTLQRGLKYTPLRKFVPSLMLYLLNSLIVSPALDLPDCVNQRVNRTKQPHGKRAIVDRTNSCNNLSIKPHLHSQ